MGLENTQLLTVRPYYIESEKDVNILSAKELGDLQDDFVVIDTCGNSTIHEEVLTTLRLFVKEKDIVTVFNA